MTETRPAENPWPNRIGSERVGDGRTHSFTRRAAVEADEIDDNATPEITQTDLLGDECGGGDVRRQPRLLGRTRFRRSTVDVDHDAGSRRLEVGAATTRKRKRLRQRLGEHCVQLDRPFRFRPLLGSGIRESGADVDNRRGVIDENVIRRSRQCASERGGECSDRVQPGGRIEARGSIEDIAPALSRSSQRRWSFHRHPGCLAALGLAANLHDNPLALVEQLATRRKFTLWQKDRPVCADIDERRAERGHKLAHPAKVNASGLGAVTALDVKFDGRSRIEHDCAPLAQPRGDQQLASQGGR